MAVLIDLCGPPGRTREALVLIVHGFELALIDPTACAAGCPVCVLSQNHRAIRSYEKRGFVLEGCEREAALVNGEWHVP